MNFFQRFQYLQKVWESLSLKQQKISIFLFFCVLILIIFFIFKDGPSDWKKVSETGIEMPLDFKYHGIDVSHHNDNINWKKVEKWRFAEDRKIAFVYVKATEGVTKKDDDFDRNWRELQKLEIPAGAYHFYLPWRDPVAQAEFFIRSVPKYPKMLPPVLDIERNSLKSDEKIKNEIGVWLRIIEAHYGQRPIIYTNGNFYKKFIKDEYEKYPLWIADYTRKKTPEYKNLWLWQYTQEAHVGGIREDVDFNVVTNEKFTKLIQ
jgi:lysozyme